MPKTSYTLLPYLAQLATPGQRAHFLRWLQVEWGMDGHPLLGLAEELLALSSETKRSARCAQASKRDLARLVEKLRLYLAIEELRTHPARQDDLLIRRMAKGGFGREFYTFIRLAKARLLKQPQKDRAERRWLYDWTNWEQHYQIHHPGPTIQDLTPQRLQFWLDWMQTELMYLGVNYMKAPVPNLQLQELLDWFSQTSVSLEADPGPLLYQRLRTLWQVLPEKGRADPALEAAVIEALHAAGEQLPPLLLNNFYLQTLNYFIHKSQCYVEANCYRVLIDLYEWGRQRQLNSLTPNFLRTFGNTYLGLAEIADTPAAQQQWITAMDAFLGHFPELHQSGELQPYRRYLDAQVQFLQGNYAAVLKPSGEESKDPYYLMSHFFLRLQVWYERGEYGWVRSLLKRQQKAKMEMKQLRSKGKMIQPLRMELFLKLLRAHKRSQLEELAREIQKPRPLEGRVWLLNKVNEKLARFS